MGAGRSLESRTVVRKNLKDGQAPGEAVEMMAIRGWLDGRIKEQKNWVADGVRKMKERKDSKLRSLFLQISRWSSTELENPAGEDALSVSNMEFKILRGQPHLLSGWGWGRERFGSQYREMKRDDSYRKG